MEILEKLINIIFEEFPKIVFRFPELVGLTSPYPGTGEFKTNHTIK
jgi:hypothetical protein